MVRSPDQHVLVLGLGNPIVSDDSVGLAVAEEVARLLAETPFPAVEVRTSFRGGFDLLDLLEGYACVVIVDSLDVPVPCPGVVHRLQVADVSGSGRLISQHEISLANVLRLGEQLSLPMPKQVVIFGVEVGDLRTVHEGLTPAVQAAVAPLAQVIYAEAAKLSAGLSAAS